MSWRRKKTRARILRAATALLLAVNHVVVALGLPMPLTTPAAESHASAKEMFPCMNCPCGCRTAEHCWRGCCCYTMTQKLAWAKAHGVTPPDFVRVAAEKESAAAAKREEPAPSCPHCHKKESAVRAQAIPEIATSGNKSVSIIKALECRGLGGGLLAAVPALLPRAVPFVPLPPPLLETLSYVTMLLQEAVLLLPTPPPRA
jgi:hypothetical protein